jgi:hypothetical protein
MIATATVCSPKLLVADEPTTAQLAAIAFARVRASGVSFKVMSEHPRCEAKLRDGSPCGRVTVTPNAPHCAHHTALAEGARGVPGREEAGAAAGRRYRVR